MKNKKLVLSLEQQTEAWRLLMAGDDNRDATIARKMGVKTQHVTQSLAEWERRKMFRINTQVNERHAEAAKTNQTQQKKRTKARKDFQIQERPKYRILDRNINRVKAV